MKKIHSEFKFAAGATTVTTPVMTFFTQKRGVCQDFAHFMISCLRSTGLAARYVSGYLLTRPPPGKPRRIGADASHAWISVFIPGSGWIDLDPTNNVIPSIEHITVGWGRDFSDVTPLRGVINGGGVQTLEIRVTVEPLAAKDG
jgi:transglutaminase-like putative cysteine protease